MPRSSRHKSSHKEAKHSSRDNREQSESEEDVKTMKSSVRVSRDSASSEKRKLSSSKVSSGHSNGDASEDYVGSKRRKEKSDVSAASDRWNGGEDEVCDVVTVEKEIKGDNLKIEAVKSLKSKALVDLKSKSSRRNDPGNEKKSEDVVLVVEKEESTRTSSRVESKRKPEKDTARKEVRDDKDPKESKEKERSAGRERKIQDSKHESEARAVEAEVGTKDLVEERKGKRSRENTELAAQGELQNPELEKELGKRSRRRREDSGDRDKDSKDKDKSQEDVKESEDIRLSSKGERTKDGRYKDVKHGEKHREDVEDVKESEDIRLSSKAERTKDGRYKDVKHGEKHREDVEDVKESEDIRLSSKGERTKDGRYKDVKHGEKNREDVGKDTSRDYKYREDLERYGRHRDVKYREDGDRNIKPKDDKYREDGDRSSRHRGDKHHEDGDKAYRHRGDRYREDGDRRDRRRDDGDRDDRHIDDQYLEDGNRDGRNKEDKNWEEAGRDGRHRDEIPRNDVDKEKRLQDAKYRDERSTRDLTSDKEEKNWEEVGRDGRHRDEKPRNDVDKDKRLQDAKYRDERSSRDLTSDKEEKNLEEVSRDGRRREEKPRNDVDKDRRLQDAKYRDELYSRDLTGDKPGVKSLRDESNATEPHYRKSNNRDVSPIYDDRRSRYNDDRGRKRSGDKDDHNDVRSRSTKEQYSDAAKFSMSNARTESMGDRGRSRAPNADIEMNSSRRRSSPGAGPHSVKDQYRNAKLEESKSRDYASDERYRHYTTSRKDLSGSTTRSVEKSFQKDESHLRELPERRSKPDSRRSPSHVVDRSPSSTSAERRLLNRTDLKRNLDTDKSGGSKDGRDYSSREGKGSREFPMETYPGDEFPQPDGDTHSVSSPFSRPGHQSGTNSRSFLLPAPPFRDSFEEDNRGKSNNRHRRNSDPNMGRLPGNAWRGVPNWPSPVANGFMPFQHGPPPVGFHPMMQPFPNPMFGVRPSMELNPPGFPYHVNDGDRYPGHGRSLGWRNPADDSCGPPIHGWDANNSGFRDESHNYGRSNWDHKRSVSGGDTWMGQNKGGTELPSAHQEDEYSSLRGPGESWSDMKDQSDKKQVDDNIDIDQSVDFCEMNNLDSSKIVPDEAAPELLRKEACPSHVYLSTLDISEDLTQPELFSEFTSRMGVDQKTGSEDGDSKLFLVEEFIDPALKRSHAISSSSLFPAINDSISQKAMSLYKKLQDETRIFREDGSFPKGRNLEAVQVSGDEQLAETMVARDQTEVEEASLPISDAVDMEISPKKISKLVEATDAPPIAALGEVEMESSSDHMLIDNPELDDAEFGTVVFSGVSSSSSSMACEAMMPPPGSVNLSRIHHQSPPPESTH